MSFIIYSKTFKIINHNITLRFAYIYFFILLQYMCFCYLKFVEMLCLIFLFFSIEYIWYVLYYCIWWICEIFSLEFTIFIQGKTNLLQFCFRSTKIFAILVNNFHELFIINFNNNVNLIIFLCCTQLFC